VTIEFLELRPFIRNASSVIEHLYHYTLMSFHKISIKYYNIKYLDLILVNL